MSRTTVRGERQRRKGHARYRGEHSAHLGIVLDMGDSKLAAMEMLVDAPRLLWNAMRWLQDLAHDECDQQVTASAIRDMAWFKRHRVGDVLHSLVHAGGGRRTGPSLAWVLQGT